MTRPFGLSALCFVTSMEDGCDESDEVTVEVEDEDNRFVSSRKGGDLKLGMNTSRLQS